MTPEPVSGFLAAHGLWLLGPAALIEGPVVTVAAGALVAQGTLPLAGVILIATVADLAGDLLLWLAGRFLRHRLPVRIRGRIARTLSPRKFRQNAGRVLVFAKLTHSMGLPVLLGAGMARVPLAAFLGYNLLATLPKVAVLVALGWVCGKAVFDQHDWLGITPVVLLVASVAISALWLRNKGKPRCVSAV